MTGTWDDPDDPPKPWVGVSNRDIRPEGTVWHPHLIPGVRTRVPEDIYRALIGTPGITWTHEPETAS